jgi:hypothetical protein
MTIDTSTLPGFFLWLGFFTACLGCGLFIPFEHVLSSRKNEPMMKGEVILTVVISVFYLACAVLLCTS